MYKCVKNKPYALTRPYPQTLHKANYFMPIFIYEFNSGKVGEQFKINGLVKIVNRTINLPRQLPTPHA